VARLPELELPAGTLLIADLHLDVVGPEGDGQDGQDGLDNWLAANPAPALIILGDLFDAWVGAGQARQAPARRVLEELGQRFPGAVHLVPGNRDFLFDRKTGAPFGIEVHRDGMLGVLPTGGRVLLVHGDEFCTQDVTYQRLKRLLRRSTWFLRALPLFLGLALARYLRRRSRKAVAHKAPAYTAMQVEAVRAAATRAGAEHVICGHAHRAFSGPLWSATPGPGAGGSDAGTGGWWVLGAFAEGAELAGAGPGELGGTGAVLRVTETGLEPHN
jgi:UDP-2,3-diacylglucosamine hydrolase